MKQILGKLHKIMTEVDYIQKDKKNSFHGYNYASEAAIKEKLHESLVKHGVIFTPVSVTITGRTEYTSDKGKRSSLTDVLMEYSFFDVDSGEMISGQCAGTGDDSADKGTYKAITGAIKYILTSTFLIPTGDDPEDDKNEAHETRYTKKELAKKPVNIVKHNVIEIFSLASQKGIADTKEQVLPAINLAMGKEIQDISKISYEESEEIIKFLKTLN